MKSKRYELIAQDQNGKMIYRGTFSSTNKLNARIQTLETNQINYKVRVI